MLSGKGSRCFHLSGRRPWAPSTPERRLGQKKLLERESRDLIGVRTESFAGILGVDWLSLEGLGACVGRADTRGRGSFGSVFPCRGGQWISSLVRHLVIFLQCFPVDVHAHMQSPTSLQKENICLSKPAVTNQLISLRERAHCLCKWGRQGKSRPFIVSQDTSGEKDTYCSRTVASKLRDIIHFCE